MSWRALAGWKAARLVAGIGAFRLLPPGQPPPEQVIDALAPHMDPAWRLAVARTNHPGRYLALIMNSDGFCDSFAKVETLENRHESLGREARALNAISPLLPPFLSAPRIIVQDGGVLVFEAVPWRARRRPWLLPKEVASAMGAFYGSASGLKPGHGDFAPWNLLRTDDGWFVLDWEDATTNTPAFFDVLHYVVQGHALLGRPSKRTVLRGLDGVGWVGTALSAYAEAAGLDVRHVRAAFVDYLKLSSAKQNRDAVDGRRGFRARQRLLEEVARSPA